LGLLKSCVVSESRGQKTRKKSHLNDKRFKVGSNKSPPAKIHGAYGSLEKKWSGKKSGAGFGCSCGESWEKYWLETMFRVLGEAHGLVSKMEHSFSTPGSK